MYQWLFKKGGSNLLLEEINGNETDGYGLKSSHENFKSPSVSILVRSFSKFLFPNLGKVNWHNSWVQSGESGNFFYKSVVMLGFITFSVSCESGNHIFDDEDSSYFFNAWYTKQRHFKCFLTLYLSYKEQILNIIHLFLWDDYVDACDHEDKIHEKEFYSVMRRKHDGFLM